MGINHENNFEREYIDTLEYENITNFKFLELRYGDIKNRFQISKPQTQVGVDTNGIEYKTITAYSLEVGLQVRKAKIPSGMYQLYNELDVENSLLHQVLLNNIPDWTIGDIDGSLINLWRHFDVKEDTVYNLLYNDISSSFECVFLFNSIDYTIDIKDVRNDAPYSDIVLTPYNVVKNISVSPLEEQLITCLDVYGGDGVYINGVNPAGTSKIYNFDYIIGQSKANLSNDSNLMSSSLVNALEVYHTKYNNALDNYKATQTNISNANIELLELQSNAPNYTVSTSSDTMTVTVDPEPTINSGLNELNSLRTQLEEVLQARVSYDGNSDADLETSDIKNRITQCDNLISQKENIIANKQTQIANYKISLNDISTTLNFKNNFTDSQWSELNVFIREDVLQDNSFIYTDVMTENEKSDVSQELFEYAQRCLARMSVPRSTLEISCINFLLLDEFEDIANKFVLGNKILLDYDNNQVAPILLGFTLVLSEDNTEILLKLGNRNKLDDGFTFLSDSFSDASKMATSYSFDLMKIEEMKEQTSQLNSYISDALNLSISNITNANETVDLGNTGLIVRNVDDYNTALWMTSGNIVFTDNNFQSAKMAIGKIKSPTGGNVYGVIADVVVGRLLAGQSLYIESDTNTFVLDSRGCFLTNAEFTITTDNNKNKIVLNPSEGISIYKNSTKTIYLKSDGSAMFNGDIYGGQIYIGGNINNPSSAPFYVDKNGNMTATSGTFKGNISGSHISGTTISGGSITIGSRFSVNSNGNMEASGANISGNVNITSGSLNIGDGNAVITNGGYATFNGVTIRNGSSSGNGTGFQLDNNGNTTINAGTINAGTINGTTINSSVLNSAEINSGALNSAEINSGVLNSVEINSGVLNSVQINSANIDIEEGIKIGDNIYMKTGTSATMTITSDSKGFSTSAKRMFLNTEEVATQSWVESNFGSGGSIDAGDVSYNGSTVEDKLDSLNNEIYRLGQRVSALESK